MAAPVPLGLAQPLPLNPAVSKGALRHELSEARKLADRLSVLANDYERFHERVKELLHLDFSRGDAVKAMRREGAWLEGALANQRNSGNLGSLLDYRKRQKSGAHQLALRLSSHMALTTGRYHDNEVSRLVNALRGKGTPRLTAESLAQLRRRHALRVRPIQSEFFDFMHDRFTGFPLWELLEEFQDDETFELAVRAQPTTDTEDQVASLLRVLGATENLGKADPPSRTRPKPGLRRKS